MEVKKPRCERLTFPRNPNYVVTGQYQTSKFVTRNLPKLKESEDGTGGNIGVGLFEAQQELYRTEERLANQRKLATEKRNALDAQWVELNRKEEELRNNFVQFNQFVKENAAKRERAANQLDDQIALLLERIRKIKVLKAEYNDMKKIKELVDRNVEKFKIYEDFLQRVVERYPQQFKNMNDVLRRYEALIHAKHVMSSRQYADLNETQQEMVHLHHLTDEYYHIIEALQMKVAILSQRYDIAKVNCIKWEDLLQCVKQEAMDKVTEFYEVKSNCLAMYLEICQRTGVDPIHVDDCEKQLECIKKALEQVESLNKMARSAEDEELMVSERPYVYTLTK